MMNKEIIKDKFTLGEITEILEELKATLLFDDLSDDDINSILDGVKGEFNAKLDGYKAVIDMLEGDIEQIKNEKRRLNSRQKSLERKVSGMKDWILFNMNKVEEKKIRTSLNNFTIVQNRPSLEIFDEDLIDENYVSDVEVKVNYNKKKMLDDLVKGEKVEGVRLKPKSEHLRIS